MQRLTDQVRPVHRCDGCQGLWFGQLAHELLREKANEIDLIEPHPVAAEAQTEAHFDPAAPAPTLLCPACVHYPLIHMIDVQQPHIRFESCKFCYGRFYDAGEFRDFADETLEEFVKRFAASMAL